MNLKALTFSSATRGLTTLAVAFLLALAVVPARADDATNAITVINPSKNTPRTVGLDIASHTVNPDKSTSLTFHWSEKGDAFERTVVANDQTIVVYNGKIIKFSDLTDDQFRAKAVATVGADGTTVVLLRFGKKPLPKDQLTPEQLKLIATLAPPPTAASDAALNRRVAGLVDNLDLNNADKEQQVSNVITADLRAVRDAHNAGLQLDPAVHQKFVAGLEANLDSNQVETVKNLLTANKVPITFRAYQEIITNLTAADDAKILAELDQAREESLDVKNVEDMNPIFKHYKEEIQNYLNSQGYNWDASYKAFVDAQKAGADK
jgi:hypothetical protein